MASGDYTSADTNPERTQDPRRETRGPKISVIIPTLNEEPWLRRAVEPLSQANGVEVIISDGGSSDGTVDQARSLGAPVITVKEGGRGRQLNQAAGAARGAILLFLHADTRLPAGFDAMVRAALSRPGVSAGAFRLGIDGRGWGLRLVERVTHFRSRYLQTPYGDQALFVTAEVFHKVGGFPEMPIMEDFVFVRRLRREGRITILDQPVYTSARRWEQLGVFRTTLLNWWMVIAFWLGVPPSTLARWYRGAPGPDPQNRIS